MKTNTHTNSLAYVRIRVKIGTRVLPYLANNWVSDGCSTFYYLTRLPFEFLSVNDKSHPQQQRAASGNDNGSNNLNNRLPWFVLDSYTTYTYTYYTLCLQAPTSPQTHIHFRFKVSPYTFEMTPLRFVWLYLSMLSRWLVLCSVHIQLAFT